MASILRNLRERTAVIAPFVKRINVSKGDVIWSSCVLSIVALAILVRILPLNWGFTLSEFDPYFHYYVTKYVVENGFGAWSQWHVSNMWYPFGRDIGPSSFPGLPFTGAIFYYIISALGFALTVQDICIVFPVIMAAVTVVIAYYFGKEVGGKPVGLLAALFLALSPAYMGRTGLGFYDDETVGIFGMLLTFLFYLRSLKQDKKWQVSLTYAIASGLSLGFVFASWGAGRYPLSLLALFTFILLIAKRYSRRLLISYGGLMGVGLAIAVATPKLGFHFIREFEGVIAIGVFLVLFVLEIAQRFKNIRQRAVFTVAFISFLGLLAILLGIFGFISLPLGKFLSVINPFERVNIPLVESVQEHRPATWSSFYYQFGTLVFLATLGIVFIMQRLTDEKIFLAIYMVTTLYFSASMVRLTIIMAPAICTLGALAIMELLKPFVDIATQRSFTKRRIRLSPKVGKGFSLVLIGCLFILTLIPLTIQGLDSGYSPTTIASSSLPIRAKIDDWSETIVWIKENLPNDAVVACWWDYGYWITVGGERISLADNGTINMTQIANIGRMFMSNETEALTILKRYNVTHVVVFTTIGLASSGQILYGDEVKWRWMAKIGGLNDTQLEDTTITSQLAQYWSQQTTDSKLTNWYDQFAQFAIPKSDTVLTKLMIYGAFKTDAPTYFQLVFSSSGWGGRASPMVFVYNVLYPL